MATDKLARHTVVSHKKWIAARKKLLAQEKAFTRARDRLNKTRRALPWEQIEKTYVFEGPEGKETLAQLFGDKSQLFVYHFMFAPGDEQDCSFWADHYDGARLHLPQRDVSFVAISRAPLAAIEAFKRRIGWRWSDSARTPSAWPGSPVWELRS